MICALTQDEMRVPLFLYWTHVERSVAPGLSSSRARRFLASSPERNTKLDFSASPRLSAMCTLRDRPRVKGSNLLCAIIHNLLWPLPEQKLWIARDFSVVPLRNLLLTRLLHNDLIQATRLTLIRLPGKENLVHNINNRRFATVWTITSVSSPFRTTINATSSEVTFCYHHALEFNKSRILAPPTILSQPI